MASTASDASVALKNVMRWIWKYCASLLAMKLHLLTSLARTTAAGMFAMIAGLTVYLLSTVYTERTNGMEIEISML
jgi:hypothetical protein